MSRVRDADVAKLLSSRKYMDTRTRAVAYRRVRALARRPRQVAQGGLVAWPPHRLQPYANGGAAGAGSLASNRSV